MRRRKSMVGWVNPRVYPARRLERNLQIYNPDRVYFCTTRRHRFCAKQNACEAMNPRCTDEELRLAGIRPLSRQAQRWLTKYGSPTDALVRRVNRKLARYFSGCNPIRVEIWR